MSDTIKDMAVSMMPLELVGNLIGASKQGICTLDTDGDGKGDKMMSSYRFLEELAKDPERYSSIIGRIGLAAGVNVAITAAAPALGLMILTGPVALAAAIAAPFFGGNRMATLVIANATSGDMKMSQIHQDSGVQSGRPVYSEVDPETQSPISSKPDVIPGVSELVPGFVGGGVGMYRFEKNLDLLIGFYGTAGAISWTFADPKVKQPMAFSWLVPETGKPAFAVTADLSKYSSLEDFYDKTAGKRKSDNLDIAAYDDGVRIRASAQFRGYPEDENGSDLVFTISTSS